jgi:hypothetical protein
MSQITSLYPTLACTIPYKYCSLFAQTGHQQPEKDLGAVQSNFDTRNVKARHLESYCGIGAIHNIPFYDAFTSYFVGGGESLIFIMMWL